MSRLFSLLILILSVLPARPATVEGSWQIVPQPRQMTKGQGGAFRLTSKTLIEYPQGNELLRRDAEFLSEYVAQSMGCRLKVKAVADAGRARRGTIRLSLDPAIGNKEGYRLLAGADGLTISGQTGQGVFYGIQTLRKAIPAEVRGGAVDLPSVSISDEPRFGYRGMHLDVCRHFFPVAFIKKYIDLLALHNLNTFHWHLTDDQGWRIEIKKYPLLTQVGSIRKKTVIGHAGSGQWDYTPYGGYYTQEEIRDVVEYARQRYINIIPEIDLPGHALAILAAYPELGCTGGPYEVCGDWGVFDDVLCIGNDKTVTFLENVLAEVMQLFPSHYIHIGGDEAPRTRWKACPKCQARIRAEHLVTDSAHTAEDRLQTWLMTRISKFITAKGREVIGWDELLDGDPTPGAVVMSWRGTQGGIKGAQLGHDVVMVPTHYCYFDYYQTRDTSHEPLAIGGFLPIDTVYSLEPTRGLNPQEAHHILGVQANLWTEYIPTEQQAEYMLLPRLAAISEVAWQQKGRKNFPDFRQRLLRLIKFYDRDSLNYSRHF